MKPFAAPELVSQAPVAGAGGLLQVTLALAAVLAAVFVFGWLLRRFRGAARPGVARIEVLAETALGTRERAVLIRVGPQQLLVGVAPGHLRTLHVFGEGVMTLETAEPAAGEGPQPAPQTPSFRALLLRSLGR